VPRFPGTLLKHRAARIWLIVVVAGLLLYAACGFLLVPRIVRVQLLAFASENYHRQAQVGEIRFNPFTLTLEARNFSFPDADGARMLAFERLMLDFDISSVWRVGASLAAVELEQPYVRVQLRKDGSLNLGDLAPRARPQAPATEKEESIGVFVDRLSVTTGNVGFEDHTRATLFATQLRPINFELRDFSTGGKTGNAYSLRGASVAGEKFAWSGSFAFAPLSTSGKFEVTDLMARTVWSYLRDSVGFEFSKGLINLNGEYFYTDGEQGGLKLEVHNFGLTDFGLRPKGGIADYIEITKLGLDETQVDLRRRHVDLGSVRIDGGTLRVARAADGRINLTDLAGTSETNSATAAGQPPAGEPPAIQATTTGARPPWLLVAPEIAIAGVRVDFNDQLVKPAASFTLMPVELKLEGFSNAENATFKVDARAVGEKTGELKVRGTVQPKDGAVAARIELNAFNLTALQPYLATYTQTTLNSGVLNTAMDFERSGAGALSAKGDVVVNKLAAVDNALKQDLIKWERVTVSGIQYGSEPARLRIARIDARAPYARLIIAPDQSLNITRLFAPAAGPAPAAVQTIRGRDGAVSAPGGNPGAMSISIGTVKIAAGAANFSDFWIKPNYAVSLQELNGSIVGLSSEPKSRAKVDINGKVDRYAPAQINGDINLLSAALYTDLKVKFQGVELTSVTPYSGHFAGYAIEKGKLSIDVAYLVENRQLSAKQKFVIDQLQLGEKVESPDAVHLPLKLAVALLKDRNGVIDIDLPMTGSLDDPQFRLGPLIWKAFVGLLTKIATAPFALLGRLGGGHDEEINRVDFDPGSSALDAAANERMGALAKALGERPALALEIPTGYSAEADTKAIAAAKLQGQLRALGDQPGATDEVRFELLRKQYEKQLGAKTPLPPTAASIFATHKKKGEEVPYDAAIDELNSALLAKQTVTEAELSELARARTQAIRDALLSSGQIDAARVFVLGTKPVAVADGKVRIELALK
jgi:outer membrane protein OmpA-like peptidoglycan-associated protein